MTDEFEPIQARGERSRLGMAVFNASLMGMIALTVWALLIRGGVVEIKAVIAGRTIPVGASREGRIGRMPLESSAAWQAAGLLFDVDDPALAQETENTSRTIRRLQARLDQAGSPACLGALQQRQDLAGAVSLLETRLNAACARLQCYSEQKSRLEQDMRREMETLRTELMKFEGILAQCLGHGREPDRGGLCSHRREEVDEVR